jgi:aminopeptidase N
MSTPKTIYLSDYQAPAYWVDSVDLRIELGEQQTLVESTLAFRRNTGGEAAPLSLMGRELELLSVSLDNRELSPAEFTLDSDGLVITNAPNSGVLRIATRIHPETNTSLEGLYKADSAFCTQCEAEGFRKITYFPDRPDVMSRYTTTIVADRQLCPVLLSNGNPVARGELDANRHWVKWEDPYPKPSYLFALVAGDLACVEDTFTTASGREVALRIYVEHHNAEKCDYAITSLHRAMRWDEEVYGLEYDLDIYMIVAVDDFNMGAMENKGLNVFNSKYVLAKPETATDDDFSGIEAVIAHEYFHNWTGNRVTCRDWFQLSLKEGLTVFRDQEFSADMGSRAVKRIQDVRVLRAAQFAEDAGPMAHPVRPHAYAEINNFYTVTIYNKGAELIRMLHTLIGKAAFRRGIDLYFDRHDGQAVTTDDFIASMQDASGVNLDQFKLWYQQAGTPEIAVAESWDAATQTFHLRFSQSIPDTPGQSDKKPMHMPVRLGLLDSSGAPIAFHAQINNTTGKPAAGTPALVNEAIIELRDADTTVSIAAMPSAPLASLFRQFSAPIKLRAKRSQEQLAFQFAHDPDPFNRWDASQSLIISVLMDYMGGPRGELEPTVTRTLVDAFRQTFNSAASDPAFVAETLMLPGDNYIADQQDQIDIDATHRANRWLRMQLAHELEDEFVSLYEANRAASAFSTDGASAGKRALRNAALSFLLELPNPRYRELAVQQYEQANNMTDSIAAVRGLAHVDGPERLAVLADFEKRWSDDSLVMDKWFGVQAASRLDGTLQTVRELLGHAEFDLRKPNKVRALIGTFCHANPARFHAADGSGYAFLREHLTTLNQLNPQIAARLVTAFSRWRRFDEDRREQMHQCMESLLTLENLSKDVHEMLSRTLGNAR